MSRNRLQKILINPIIPTTEQLMMISPFERESLIESFDHDNRAVLDHMELEERFYYGECYQCDSKKIKQQREHGTFFINACKDHTIKQQNTPPIAKKTLDEVLHDPYDDCPY